MELKYTGAVASSFLTGVGSDFTFTPGMHKVSTGPNVLKQVGAMYRNKLETMLGACILIDNVSCHKYLLELSMNYELSLFCCIPIVNYHVINYYSNSYIPPWGVVVLHIGVGCSIDHVFLATQNGSLVSGFPSTVGFALFA